LPNPAPTQAKVGLKGRFHGYLETQNEKGAANASAEGMLYIRDNSTNESLVSWSKCFKKNLRRIPEKSHLMSLYRQKRSQSLLILIRPINLMEKWYCMREEKKECPIKV
jgi:hypothetical protein